MWTLCHIHESRHLMQARSSAPQLRGFKFGPSVDLPPTANAARPLQRRIHAPERMTTPPMSIKILSSYNGIVKRFFRALGKISRQTLPRRDYLHVLSAQQLLQLAHQAVHYYAVRALGGRGRCRRCRLSSARRRGTSPAAALCAEAAASRPWAGAATAGAAGRSPPRRSAASEMGRMLSATSCGSFSVADAYAPRAPASSAALSAM